MAFSNNCWYQTLSEIKEKINLDVDILILFEIASDNYNSSLKSIGFDKEVKLGDQVPIEIVETILKFIDVRIQLRSSGEFQKSRWIGADYTRSVTVITDFYICHSGVNLDADMGLETGHYSLEFKQEQLKQIEFDRVYAQSISC